MKFEKQKFQTGIPMETKGTALRQEREVRTHGTECNLQYAAKGTG